MIVDIKNAYRTQDGNPVRIDRIELGTPQPVVGADQDESGYWTKRRWHLDGRFLSNISSGLDLCELSVEEKAAYDVLQSNTNESSIFSKLDQIITPEKEKQNNSLQLWLRQSSATRLSCNDTYQYGDVVFDSITENDEDWPETISHEEMTYWLYEELTGIQLIPDGDSPTPLTKGHLLGTKVSESPIHVGYRFNFMVNKDEQNTPF